MEMFEMIFALLLIGYLFYKYVSRHDKFFEKLNIPYIKPSFQNSSNLFIFFQKKRGVEYLIDTHNAFPNHKIFGVFNLRDPMIYLRDVEVIKQLIVKDFDHFGDRGAFVRNNLDRLFDNSIMMLRGKRWRQMRATLSPVFTGVKMKQMFPLIVDCAEEMSQYILKQIKMSGEYNCDIRDMISRYTNDVIVSTAYGVKINSFEHTNNEFFKAGKSLVKLGSPKYLLKMLLLKHFPKLMQLLDIELIDKKHSNFFRSAIIDTMNKREKDNISRQDIIDTLIQIRKGNINSYKLEQEPQEDMSTGFATVKESTIGKMTVQREWSDDELVAQCFIFFKTGFDTSSRMLTHLYHAIATNPNVQEKLYDEVLNTHNNLDGKPLHYDILQTMTYMDMVISETLRMWPPAILGSRICTKDYRYEDENLNFIIKKNMGIWIPTYAIQHDPAFFPNPNKFDPERFSDANKVNILPGTYMPFGIGPHNCIASRFGLMEMKAVLYYSLLTFEFIPNKETQIPMKVSVTPIGIRPVKTVKITIKLRK